MDKNAYRQVFRGEVCEGEEREDVHALGHLPLFPEAE